MDPRPAIPVAVDIDATRVRIDLRTGERQQEIEHVYTEYDVGRIRAGYVCLHCGEAQIERECSRCKRDGKRVTHQGPFPEHCFCCGFPMRTEQLERFAKEFDGYTTVGPSKSLAEIRADDEEAKERARRNREGRSTSSVVLPSGVWLPNG